MLYLAKQRGGFSKFVQGYRNFGYETGARTPIGAGGIHAPKTDFILNLRLKKVKPEIFQKLYNITYQVAYILL